MKRLIFSLSLLLTLVSISACTGQDKVAEARKLLDAAQYESAEKAYAALMTADSDNPEVHWGLGKSRIQLGRLEEALPNFGKAIALATAQKVADSTLGKFYLDRGLTHYALARFSPAQDDFQKTIDLGYKLGEAYAYLGVTQGNSGDDITAISTLNTALKHDPENHFALSNRGYYNSLVGDNKTAISDFTRAIAIKADDKVSYLNRGYTYIGLGDYPTAIKDFQKALEIDPEYVGAITYMGIALTNSGQPADALSYLDKAITQQPENAALYYYRGTARINAGMKAEGCEDLYLARDKGDPQSGAMIAEYCD